ncbi:hypothetical protein HAT86_16510 [Roseovarius gahaiensis]|uniref:Uncharacterized protein n=1 Tax=Roseovarius gahaiensis TaxID=2716691 RepID=A0A967BIF2_9RHOB|nr:hypothetical protein [Roseovarius gahaiensis]NHQ76048.1 hypothetical protein [Roseovarius gahaiensis]
MFIAQLNKGKMREDLQKDTYGASYRALVKLAEASRDDPQHDAAHSLACAVYAWMPTILKDFKIEKIDSVTPLKTVKAIKSWEEAEIFISQIDDVAPINGSWVGTSKFLHLLNPEIFPIWDSRVAVSFHSKLAAQAKAAADRNENLRPIQLNYFCNRKDHYLEYLKFMMESVEKSSGWVDVMQKKIKGDQKHFPTKLRCLELAFFNRYPRIAL